MKNCNNTVVTADSEYENILEIRDKLANTILICIAFLSTPLIYISFLRYLEVGGFLLISIRFIIYLFSLAVAFYRKKIPLKSKALLVIGWAFLMAVTSIAK